MGGAVETGFSQKVMLFPTHHRPVGVVACPSTWPGLDNRQSEDTPRTTPGPSHNRPHTLRQPCQNGRCLPALRSGRVCNGRSPPPPSRAWRPRAPDEGRCRADPHCTHNGIGRHRRINNRYFYAGSPTNRFGSRDDQWTCSSDTHEVARLSIRGICHAIERSERNDDDCTTCSTNNHYDNDTTTGGRDKAGSRHRAQAGYSNGDAGNGDAGNSDPGACRTSCCTGCRGAGDRRHQRRHRRLGVHQDARVERSLQQCGSTVRRLWHLDQHMALVRAFRLAVSGGGECAGPNSVGAACALRLGAVELALRLRLVDQPPSSMAVTWPMSK